MGVDEAERGGQIHRELEFAFLHDEIVHACLILFVRGDLTQEESYALCYKKLFESCREKAEALEIPHPVIVPWVEGDLQAQANILALLSQLREGLLKELKRKILRGVP